jgi:hypothetical protein
MLGDFVGIEIEAILSPCVLDYPPRYRGFA